MTRRAFNDFFRKATGNTPYNYQCRLACGLQADPDKPATLLEGAPCQSQLINIPTGLGKTAAVVLAWLWNRVRHPEGAHREKWPLRLVYCLPMRTLVEQTDAEVKKWLNAHGLLWDGNPANRAGKVGVHILMGGEDAGEWDIYPEENAILIGTQDMLLSRALNRGYGMSRYRWPMHFGLLNNDCLWVMDETQLMGVGVETSAQLDGFRGDSKRPTVCACPTWWMSATLDDARLATVDHPKPHKGWLTTGLSDGEKADGRPHELITAKKTVSALPIVLSSDTKSDYPKQLAGLIKERHQPGTLTLVVVNRVSRAREVYEALAGGKQPLYDSDRVALIHSRFRPVDRRRHTALLFGDENGKRDRIVIATQTVEAGVDVSARLLITELAPWSSLVQRIGRCNRRAEIPDAQVLWVNIVAKDAHDDLLLPYSDSEISEARKALAKVTNASPEVLSKVEVPAERVIRPVVRRRDLVDLFDTTPDVCGQDLDISRYIRDGEDKDVQFFWRDIGGNSSPDENEPRPCRDELCRVSLGEAAKFIKKSRAWRWDQLEMLWKPATSPTPGAVYLIAAESGGYDDALGWTGAPKVRQLTVHCLSKEPGDSHDDNGSTFKGKWVELDRHTKDVVAELRNLSAGFPLSEDERTALLNAARWHDLGKAHDVFQKMLCSGDSAATGKVWAKSENKLNTCTRRGFRHELASAIAWLLAGPFDASERDLAGYLIASHHGKVRLSIRSLPDEPVPDLPPMPDGTDRLFARGIWHQDKNDAEKHDVLPSVNMGDLNTPEIPLDLTFMRMGEGPHGPSWLARAIALRDQLGPFRLAFLETLLRAADARASRVTT